MVKKNTIIALTGISLLVGCSGSQNAGNNSLPNPNDTGSSGSIYMKAKAEFDLSSSPDGSAQFNLVKKSYATAPNCLHGQCTDYTDITVTNTGSTQFELSQSQAQISQNTSNQNLSNIVDLKIGQLFDNNLTSCGGQKCIAAAIRVYTTDTTGVQGPGLWSQAIGKSVPLTISGGSSASSLALIPYFSAAGTHDDGVNLQVDMEALSISQNVLSLAGGDFSDANGTIAGSAGYTLSADFTQAGAGSYKAHVVVEYDLIGPAAPAPSPSPSPSPSQSMSASAKEYVVGFDNDFGDAAYWVNGAVTLVNNADDGRADAIVVDSSGNIYVSGNDDNALAAYWSNNVETILDQNGGEGTAINVDSSGNVYVAGFDSNGAAALWKNGVETVLDPDGSSALSINFDPSGNVYVAGADGSDLTCYWKVSGGVVTKTLLANGTGAAVVALINPSSHALTLAGADVSGAFSALWNSTGTRTDIKNSVSTLLTGGTYSPSGQVYFSGIDESTGNPIVWKNPSPGSANETILDAAGNSTVGVATDSSNNVYVLGIDHTDSYVIWKSIDNGTSYQSSPQNYQDPVGFATGFYVK